MTKTVDELMRLHEIAAEAFSDYEDAFEEARPEYIELSQKRLDADATLRSALEEVVRDAERYRWLCTSSEATFVNFEGMCSRGEPRESIDAAVDDAMKERG